MASIYEKGVPPIPRDVDKADQLKVDATSLLSEASEEIRYSADPLFMGYTSIHNEDYLSL